MSDEIATSIRQLKEKKDAVILLWVRVQRF